MATRRKYDIVMFGATGFTGGLTAEYLAKNAGEKVRWALAGRSLDKLELTRARLTDLNPACKTLALLEADVNDEASIEAVAKSAHVVITTVGPYIKYGEPLVKACAEAGTDYVDLTGEPEFVDAMWLKYHETARKSGARIVHACGFDSIPHDLGAYFTVQQLPGDVAMNVEGFVRAGGDFSGGTFHSAVTAFSRIGEYARVRKQRRAREEYPIDRKIGSTRQTIRFEKQVNQWVVPFPSIDPQVVRRSAVALDRYGPNFRYGHYIQVKKLSGVAKLVGGAGALMAAAQIKFTRDKVLKFKDPGQGPSESVRAKSWFKITFIGRGGGQTVRCEVAGGDPGYGETSKMLAESALCLALDKLPKTAGSLTPAVAMGDALIKRLQKAGISFSVV